MTTTAEYLVWLRTHHFERYCMVCRHLTKYCRMFSHFGGPRWDWEQERIVYPDERN